MRNGIRLFLYTAFLVIGAGARGEAAEWFVAPNGSGNGSSSAPFGRIQDGINAAQPGDIVTVRAGSYSETLRTARSGTAAAAITLRADGDRGSVIVTATGKVLQVDHAYFLVEKMVFDGNYGLADALDVNNAAQALVLRNVEVRRAGRDCIDMNAPPGVLIEDSLIHHCLARDATGARMDAHGITAGAAQTLTIRNTEIHTFSGDAVQVDPGRSAPGWSGLTIEGCRFWLAPLDQAENGFAAGVVPGENAVDTKSSSSFPRATVTIRNTDVWGFKDGPIGNMAAFNLKENVAVTVDRVTAWSSEIAFRLRAPALVTVQNAIVHHVATAVRYEDNIQGLHIWNSTFGLGVSQPFVSASSSGSVLDVKNLLLLGTSLPAQASGSSNLAVSAASFVNATADDYHLVAGSSAIDAGVAIGGVQEDRDGIHRPQGNGYDVGAYEHCLACAQGSALVANPASGLYGGKTTLKGTLTASGSPLAGETLSFTLHGSWVGNATSNSDGVAKLPNVSLSGLNAGTYPAAVEISFDGNGTYAAARGTADLTVSRATPAISWANPADIVVGTPLSGTQLNAVASVPGSYTYTPPAGTILSEDQNQQLSVQFAPTDALNYKQASATVSINVLSASTAGTLTVSPSTVTGCRSATGNITLDAPAPAGGVSVALASDHLAAGVPSSVIIPEGSSSRSFTITTSPVSTTQVAHITATVGSETASSSLTLRPISVGSVSLSPNPIVGGNNVSGTVTLECAAGPGQIVVALSSGDTSVAAPTKSSITIAGGVLGGSFTVKTADVVETRAVGIRATANGRSSIKKLTVNP